MIHPTRNNGTALLAAVLVALLVAPAAAQIPGSIKVESEYLTIATPYTEDFEDGDGGFTVVGDALWEHGEPTVHVTPVSGQGPKMFGTNLGGNYPSRQCSALQSPEIDLSGYLPGAETGASTARLQFRHWFHLEERWDGGVVQASSDGVEWRVLTPVDGYQDSMISSVVRGCLGVEQGEHVFTGPRGTNPPPGNVWRSDEFDLSAFLGGPLHLRWVTGTDSSRERLGWYVDDISIEVGAGVRLSIDLPEVPSIGTGVPFSPLTNLYATDFEDSGADWKATGDWEWGQAVSPPLPNTGGVNMWGTTLSGDYPANSCSTLTSPAISLPGAPAPDVVQTAELNFSLWRHADSGYDGAVLQISTDDGANWSRLEPVGGYDRTIWPSSSANVRDCLGVTTSDRVWSGPFSEPRAELWETVTADLTPFMGSDVRFRFVFGSNGDQATDPHRGVYIDDVLVKVGLGLDNVAPEVPLSAAPAQLPIVDWDAIGTIADDRLLDALKQDPAGTFPAVVLGPERERVYESDFASREEAFAHLTKDAQPFFAAMDAVAARTGAEIVHRHAFGPAVSITGGLVAFDHIAGMEGVRRASLDDEGSVYLIEPIRDDSISTANTAGRQMLQAEDIWAAGFMGENITISIIDTGIDPTHEAFKFADGSSRIVGFVDYVNGATDAYDDHGHGTHVGATAAGSNLYDDPEFGPFQEVGVAPRATLLGAKFLSSGGSGSTSNGILALNWSFNNGADITSNSWGTSGCTSSHNEMIEVIGELADLGMLSVFAAGNRGPGSGTIGAPGCAEDALTVGAVSENELIASFSSRGPCSDPFLGTGQRICPDVVAKGVAVRSAIPRSGASAGDPSGYKTWQGTSMATPHVSGAVALAEQMKRELTGTGWDTSARAEETLFKLTSKDLGVAGEDNDYGWGLPQLLDVHQLIAATDEANVVSLFDVTPTLLHQGDASDIVFRVRNLGGAEATGDFTVTIEDPSGAIDVRADRDVSLGLLGQEAFDDRFVVTSDVAHGNYTVEARYDFSWTDGDGVVHTDSVGGSAIIEVKRVSFDMAIDGFAPNASLLVPQALEVSATNDGNEDGTGVSFEFTVPDSYVFVPGDNYDPFSPLTRYANPAPDRVKEDSTFGRVTLIFEVGDAPVGSTFSFTTNIAPTELGSAKALLVAKYTDGAGNAFNQATSATQNVELGLPST